MADSHGYMEYDFASLKKTRKLEPIEAMDTFLTCFRLKGKFNFKDMFEFADLERILIDDFYLVMNNEPRRKGNKIFFTGNVVEAQKYDLLSYISEPIKNHNIIVPLLIVPVTYDIKPAYMLAAQEDPVFELFTTNEEKD